MKKLLLYSILLLNLNLAFSQWNQIGQTLTGARLLFGNSVSISGDGLRIATIDKDNNGYVNVYELQGTSWQALGNPIGPLTMGFNNPVDLDYDGDRLVVSGVGGNPDSYGLCFLTYSFNGTDWEQLGNTHICGDYMNLIIENYSGDAKISDDGARIMVAAADVGNLDVWRPGVLEVYELIGDEWTLMGDSFIIGYNIYGDRGVNMAMNADGSKIAIGDPNSPTIHSSDMPPIAYEFGSARVYEWQGNTWVSTSTNLNDSSANFGRNFGSAVSFNAAATRIAIGAVGDDTDITDVGIVKVFQQNASDASWSQLGNTIYGETTGHEIGRDVTLNSTGNVLAIGAAGADAEGNYSVKVYRLIDDVWTLVDTPIILGDTTLPWNNLFYQPYNSFIEFSETGRLALAFPYGETEGRVQVFENPSLSIKEAVSLQLELYPNPFANTLSIKLKKIAKGTWSITSLQGQQILQGDFSSKQIQLDVSKIKTKGVYFLKVETAKGTITKKIIKT
ncbi:T9SS type A sorting domain-containing protein [uncultured Kordia sp.]|uniref:T9SS type A sorting domain-containing protein n=1 Tax=uncultured Kordia sp. TaxID=507699 RepID=UPI00262EFC93|nr:T9SS type A sorting domain-containing protein [uncultured Kordia sp.]